MEVDTNVRKINVFQSPADHQWYWNAVAGNGEIVTSSEGYTRKDNAVSAAAGVFPNIQMEVEDPAPEPTQEPEEATETSEGSEESGSEESDQSAESSEGS